MAQSLSKLNATDAKNLMNILGKALDELRCEYLDGPFTPASQTLKPFGTTPQLLTPDTLPPPLQSEAGTPFCNLANLPQADISAPNPKEAPRISKHTAEESRIPAHDLLLSTEPSQRPRGTKPASVPNKKQEPQNLGSKFSGTTSADESLRSSTGLENLWITIRNCDSTESLLRSQRPGLWDVAKKVRASIKECSKITKNTLEELEHLSRISEIAAVLSAVRQSCKVLVTIFEELLLMVRTDHVCMGICASWHDRHDRRFSLFAQHLEEYLDLFRVKKNVKQLGVLWEHHSARFRQWLGKIRRYYVKFDILVLQEETRQMKMEQIESRHEHEERQRHHPDDDSTKNKQSDAEMTERIRQSQGRLRDMMLQYLNTA